MNDDLRSWLMRRAIQGAPLEVCGFIMKDDSVIEIPNTSANPESGFLMSVHHLSTLITDPDDIVAIWHTHPNGTTHLSGEDIRSMVEGYIYPDWEYYTVTASVVTKWNVKEFLLQGDSFWKAFASSVTEVASQ